MSTKEPGREDLNRRERNCIEMLVVSTSEVAVAVDALKARAKQADPHCMAYIKCALGLLRKAQDLIYATVPTRQLLQLQTVCKNGYAEIRMPSASCPPNYYPVSVKDANTIIGAAVNDRCKVCFEDKAYCDKCELRKALLNVHPPMEYDRFQNCPYQNAQWADPDQEPDHDYM